jgi:hypothetical protein
MENMRCPFCGEEPVFHRVPGGYWVASCRMITCRLGSDIVLQPSLPEAQAQWNHVMEQFGKLA